MEATQFFYASDDKCWYEMAATIFRAAFFHASHVWAVSRVLSSAPEV